MASYNYRITIDGSAIGQNVGVGTGDGFIDPTTIEQYRTNTLQTGTTFGTITIGQTVFINDIEVEMTGTTVGDVVTAINSLTPSHHVIAGTSGGNLTLIKSTFFPFPPLSVRDGTSGITSQLGFITPITSVVVQATSKSEALAKKRGNWRWKFLLEHINKSCNIDSINSVLLSGIDTTFATNPTSIVIDLTFREEFYFGSSIGTTALKAAVVEMILNTDQVTDIFYDPTNTTPNPPPIVDRGNTAQVIEIGALTTNSTLANNAVTVIAL